LNDDDEEFPIEIMNILCTIIATNHTQMQFEAEVELFVEYYLSKIIPSQERDCDIAFAF